jgi:hypothetical protein
MDRVLAVRKVDQGKPEQNKRLARAGLWLD